ncbi:hypothetical protein RN001_007192 [Aquatica leii]|uniref:Uncharacterized protein n=1 Tax=Aquatica leii TaxID=1421715 RepID=A0AAN7S903_9COLE|nr:hypothetical protein RN001_007192 [Aquatica leii]
MKIKNNQYIQWNTFKNKNPWLEANNGKLGCHICREIFSKVPEWCECHIEPTLNENRATQLSNLRCKIKKHVNSKAYKFAIEINNQTATNALAHVIHKESQRVDEVTNRIFRTAYNIAKSDRPFSDHKNLIKLQKYNGGNMGITLLLRYNASQIVQHITKEMKRKMIAQIVQNNIKISLEAMPPVQPRTSYVPIQKNWSPPPSSIKLAITEAPCGKQRLRVLFQG